MTNLMSGGGNTDWMKGRTAPSQKAWKRYQRGQANQYNPAIRNIKNQLGSVTAENDPMVQAYNNLLAKVPGQEQITSAYGKQAQDLSKYISGLDMTAGGKGVSSIISGIGGALGLDATQVGNTASAAGFVSGEGGQGGDVYGRALMQGANANMMNLESQRLSDAESRRQELTLGGAGAAKDVQSQRYALENLLADTTGKARSSATNPLTSATDFMSFLTNQKTYRDAMSKDSSSGSGSGTQTPTPDSVDLGKYAGLKATGTTRRDMWNRLNTTAQGGIIKGRVNPFTKDGKLKPGYNINGTKK